MQSAARVVGEAGTAVPGAHARRRGKTANVRRRGVARGWQDHARRMAKWLLVMLVVGACASDEDDPGIGDGSGAEHQAAFDDGKGDGPPSADWLVVGNGVAYQQVSSGNGVLIAYGGYTAKLAYSAAWAEELVDAKLGAADVGHIYAVKGPQDASYSAREIGNSKLRAHLTQLADADGQIYIVAHSSGSFVAHELFQQAHAAGDTALLARISYANLDGGGTGLSNQIVSELGAATFVYARDPDKGRSQNAGTAIALAAAYVMQGATQFEVTVSNTGCASGAGWCLHDVVITHRPHNPNSYDLARDYTDFVNRPVTTEYFDPLLPTP